MELPDPKSTMFAVNGNSTAEHWDEIYAFWEVLARLTRCRKRVRKSCIFQPTYKQWADGLFHRHRQELKALYRAHHAEDANAEKAAIDRILRSFAGRACAVLRLHLAKQGPEITTPLTRKALEKLVNSFSLFDPLPGKAELVLIAKSGGECRPTLKFDWEAKAAQLLTQDVLEAKGLSNPYEFARAKKGRDRAARSVRDDIEAGYHHWVLADIKDCYSSIKPKHLEWLNLPRRVIRHSVFLNADMSSDCQHNQSGYLKAARHGLAQGAMLSGIIASGLIGRVLRTIPGDIGVRSYVDDMAICARFPAVTANIRNAVESGFNNLEAGPLTFKYLEIANAEAGFSFLNYRFRLETDKGQERVHIHPDHAAFKNLQAKLDKKLTDLNSKCVDEKVTTALEYVARWRAGHPLWAANAYALNNLEGFAEICAGDHGTICAMKHVPLLGFDTCIGSQA